MCRNASPKQYAVCVRRSTLGHFSQGGSHFAESSYEFSWLPPNGFKCAPNALDRRQCELRQCSKPDTAPLSVEEPPLFGLVGAGSRAVFNCASTTGYRSGGFNMRSSLPVPPDVEGTRNIEVDNTLANRAALYRLYPKPSLPPADEEAGDADDDDDEVLIGEEKAEDNEYDDEDDEDDEGDEYDDDVLADDDEDEEVLFPGQVLADEDDDAVHIGEEKAEDGETEEVLADDDEDEEVLFPGQVLADEDDDKAPIGKDKAEDEKVLADTGVGVREPAQ